MKLNKLSIIGLTFFISLIGCKSDDDAPESLVTFRDRAEVYQEDIAEIETFLKTHKYNVEDFDMTNVYSNTSTSPVSNTQNDNFVLSFQKLPDGTPESESIFGLLDDTNTETVNTLRYVDVTDNAGQSYRLYYLIVREGLGSDLHPLDVAVTKYFGTSIGYNSSDEIIEDVDFDSSPTPISFNLTSLGAIPGVVQGFRDGLVNFKSSETFTEANNGEVTYHNHGIGAIFVPSGLGYFAQPIGGLDAYTPIMFKINLLGRVDTDFDSDNIPSHLEDLNANGNGFDEDTDSDGLNNFFDNDDDNDGILTRDEDLEDTDLNFDSDGDGDPTNDKNGDGNPLNDDTDGDGIPNYLDFDTAISRD